MNPVLAPPRRSYTILPGRFQPPHNDHVALLRHVLGGLAGRVTQLPGVGVSDRNPPHTVAGEPGAAPLYLGLVVDAPALPADPGAPPALDAEARRQNQPARNPFTFAERLAMWQGILAGELADLPAPVIVPLPRPESAWPWMTALFPGKRTWIVPACGEAFDDMKAAFFAGKGDGVERVRQHPTTDGRRVRALLGRPARLCRHVPPSVVRWITSSWRPAGQLIGG